MIIPAQQYTRAVQDICPYFISANLAFYLTEQLFEGISFENKNVLDIGAGVGIYGLYAAARGARRVDLLEPEMDGSSEDMINRLNAIKKSLSLDNAFHIKSTFQNFESVTKYDIILSHNSINHFNEEACAGLLENSESLKYFNDVIFKKLSRITEKNGLLILADAGRTNFFGMLGLRSPFARSIEWRIHQDPSTWAQLLEPFGFKREKLRRTSFNTLRTLGTTLTNNIVSSFFTHSHFILYLDKTGGDATGEKIEGYCTTLFRQHERWR